jgi:hypothetical protein
MILVRKCATWCAPLGGEIRYTNQARKSLRKLHITAALSTRCNISQPGAAVRVVGRQLKIREGPNGRFAKAKSRQIQATRLAKASHAVAISTKF